MGVEQAAVALPYLSRRRRHPEMYEQGRRPTVSVVGRSRELWSECMGLRYRALIRARCSIPSLASLVSIQQLTQGAALDDAHFQQQLPVWPRTLVWGESLVSGHHPPLGCRLPHPPTEANSSGALDPNRQTDAEPAASHIRSPAMSVAPKSRGVFR